MVEERYKKGQIKLSVAIKPETNVLWNMCWPANLLILRKKIVQKIPKEELKRIAVLVILFNFSIFFSSWALATIGSKRTLNELDRAEGKKMSGIAMPVKTP